MGWRNGSDVQRGRLDNVCYCGVGGGVGRRKLGLVEELGTDSEMELQIRLSAYWHGRLKGGWSGRYLEAIISERDRTCR